VPAAELRIELGESDRADAPSFEPFDALVGPVRVDATGDVADVIPVEPFLELRARLGAEGAFTPQVVFAHADGTHELDPIEAVASDAVTVDTLTLLDLDA
jgi:hypothetical protein